MKSTKTCYSAGFKLVDFLLIEKYVTDAKNQLHKFPFLRHFQTFLFTIYFLFHMLYPAKIKIVDKHLCKNQRACAIGKVFMLESIRYIFILESQGIRCYFWIQNIYCIYHPLHRRGIYGITIYIGNFILKLTIGLIQT